jgi:hypothetical protein
MPHQEEIVCDAEVVGPGPETEINGATPRLCVGYFVWYSVANLIVCYFQIDVKDEWENAGLSFHKHDWYTSLVQPCDCLVQTLQVFFRIENKHPCLGEVGTALEA